MRHKFLTIIILLSFSLAAYPQDNNHSLDEPFNKNVVGINIGIAALEVVLDESGLQVEFYYQRKLNKMFFVGVEQGFIIQDNFPSNFYPAQGAPYHLPPEIDGYIRNISFSKSYDTSWEKTTMIYLTPVIGANLLRYKRFSFGISTGIGIAYRNFTRFSVISMAFGSDQKVVDYKENYTLNSVIAPILNVSFMLSQALTPSLGMQLNFKYNHELSNFEDPKNAGSSDYMALRLGISKTF